MAIAKMPEANRPAEAGVRLIGGTDQEQKKEPASGVSEATAINVHLGADFRASDATKGCNSGGWAWSTTCVCNSGYEWLRLIRARRARIGWIE
jgi:hypothetical protein